MGAGKGAVDCIVYYEPDNIEIVGSDNIPDNIVQHNISCVSISEGVWLQTLQNYTIYQVPGN